MWFYSVDKDNFSNCTVSPGHKFPNGQELIKVTWGAGSDNEMSREFSESALQYTDPETGEIRSKLVADDQVEVQSDSEFGEMLQRVLNPGGTTDEESGLTFSQ